MILNRHFSQSRGFTMVEIALSIAVVAFALVAILGVLPTGMTVQKDNRDDSIINQEGRYWMEAIRSGARGLDDITNYVEAITITNVNRSTRSVTFESGQGGNLLSPTDIIALLSTGKYWNGSSETNHVYARVKAISGPASEKGPLTNEFSFRYQMQVEITPTYPAVQTTNDLAHALALSRTLHELRLTFRWPVVQRGNGWHVGNSRKTFRAKVAGTYILETNVTPQVLSQFRSSLGNSLVTLVPNRFDAGN